jgi:hypothetical protein
MDAAESVPVAVRVDEELSLSVEVFAAASYFNAKLARISVRRGPFTIFHFSQFSIFCLRIASFHPVAP